MEQIQAGNILLDDSRRMWKYIVFGILTLGIYDLIFMWKMVNDLNTVCGATESGDEDRSPNYIIICVLTIFTFGIYNFFWYYKQGNRMKRAGHVYGLEIDEKGSSYLMWILLGVLLFGVGPVVALYLFICNMNKLCRMYNYHIQNGGGVQRAQGKGWDSSTPETYQYYDNNYMPVPEDMTTQKRSATGRIRCISGVYNGSEIELRPDEELLIGRNSVICGLVIQEPDISRTHCTIKYSTADGNYYVVDQSTFGVIQNDSHKLTRGVSTKCPVGTKLTLGKGNNVFILQ